MTAYRISHGAEIERNRNGTLPAPTPRRSLAGPLALAALGWLLGYLCGVVL